MKIIILALLLFFSTPIYANQACIELSLRGEKIMIDRQNGVPKTLMKTGTYVLGLSTKAMKGLINGMIEDVYEVPKVKKDLKLKIAYKYRNSIKKDCERIIFFQDNL